MYTGTVYTGRERERERTLYSNWWAKYHPLWDILLIFLMLPCAIRWRHS